ncbi:MAG TPA: hypothetical protein VNG32_01885 [Candidatus Dormibacteraeota bacterium]|nr:hypothetical protein [Candidatus Dormibacteraeota bacterium]
MDSLSDILHHKDFDEPPEMSAIKKYVYSEFKVEVGVQVRERDIVVMVPNSALANTLRLRGPDIKRRCQLTKRLTFRIG